MKTMLLSKILIETIIIIIQNECIKKPKKVKYRVIGLLGSVSINGSVISIIFCLL